MKRIRERLTYANVVATLALFLVLAGGSALAANQLAKNSVGSKQLKRNAVTSAKIKNGAVTGAKIKAGSLGTVPSAQNAANAGALGGTPASGYVKTDLEPVHVFGAPGEPPLEAGCENYDDDLAPAGFYKDSFGVVHLRGYITGCSESDQAFVLPAGFRPQAIEFFAAVRSNEEAALVEVGPDGKVWIFGGAGTASLSGIEFRTR